MTSKGTWITTVLILLGWLSIAQSFNKYSSEPTATLGIEGICFTGILLLPKQSWKWRRKKVHGSNQSSMGWPKAWLIPNLLNIYESSSKNHLLVSVKIIITMLITKSLPWAKREIKWISWPGIWKLSGTWWLETGSSWIPCKTEWLFVQKSSGAWEAPNLALYVVAFSQKEPFPDLRLQQNISVLFKYCLFAFVLASMKPAIMFIIGGYSVNFS